MDFDLTNPEFTEKLSSAGGIAELADAAENPPEEMTEEETQEAEELLEEAEEESEESEEEETPEEEPEEDEKDKNFASLRQQLQSERERAERNEMELMQLKQAIIEAGKQAAPEEDEYEPLDEKQAAEIEQLKKQQAQMQFQNAMNSAQAKAVQDYPDFNDAWSHLAQQKVGEMMDLGMDQQTAAAQTARSLQSAAALAMQKGQDLGTVFYNLAKRNGYQATPVEKKPTGLNPKNIEKNRKKTEKKPAKLGIPEDMETGSVVEMLAKMSKPGRGVDTKDFKKLLAKAKS